ncbi:hypothetical protein ACFVTM_04105 [Arthrobacter sp. NPDC058130]|uniref:hypothetical protein n=1 Tax=Arthrobacter sp. NPDC058130 TaxID=3346353 RepID=UPI0036EEB5A5
MTDKFSILVRVDVEDACAQVSAQGHVTAENIRALYMVLNRANNLRTGLDLEIDIRRARVDPEALEQLLGCALTHHLPLSIDPSQADCRLSILPPITAASTGPLELAA